MSEEALIVLCTCPDETSTHEVTTALLEHRLAACVNRVAGIESWYRWEGRVEQDREYLLLIKTTAASYPALERLIIEMHPHDVPEVLAVAVDKGSARYLDWIVDSVG